MTTAVVVTIAMISFPPYTSFYGTEYAFILDGPEWARQTQVTLVDFELGASIYWALLGVQLLTLWAITFAATLIFGKRPALLAAFYISLAHLTSIILPPNVS